MAEGSEGGREETVQRAIEAAIRIGVVALILLWVFDIVAPFIQPILWGAIIAVAGNGPYRRLSHLLGGRDVLAAVIFTVFALVVLITPMIYLTGALVDWGHSVAAEISDGELEIPPAPTSVREWPIVGGPIYEFWALANSNVRDALERAQTPLRSLGVWLLRSVASAGFGVLQFVLSILIAGGLLANSAGAVSLVDRFAVRLAPQGGAKMSLLAEQTIRGVATGVVGVAILQCLLAAMGFFAVGVPGAAFIALVCLLVGVVQLPMWIPTLPVTVYVWMQEPTLTAVLFTLWIVPVTLLDNFLKPILMGRGVAAPMLVVFIGAIGGFASSGIVGLFVGAVVMVVAYELMRAWLEPASAEVAS